MKVTVSLPKFKKTCSSRARPPDVHNNNNRQVASHKKSAAVTRCYVITITDGGRSIAQRTLLGSRNKRFGNSLFTLHVASVQCLLHFGRVFSPRSLYPRYVRDCTRERSHDQCWLTLEFIPYSTNPCQVNPNQIRRTSNGFHGAGPPVAKLGLALPWTYI